MTLFYIGGLVVLVAVGFFFGRLRAVAAANVGTIHSRPNYHGAFVALAVLAPMLFVLIFGLIIADKFVEIRTIDAFDPAVASDGLKKGRRSSRRLCHCGRQLLRRSDPPR